MGNKKKTKWRKVPPAELSQIKVKNSIVEKTRSNDKLLTDEKPISNVQHIKNSELTEYCSPEEFPAPDHSKIGKQDEANVSGGETYCSSADEASGIYVNGLWIPVPQQRKLFGPGGPENILQTSSFLIPPSPSFCPSTCPRFQTIHAPDVPLHPNYFVPSSSHYLYYFFKGPPAPEFGRDDCTVKENGTNDYGQPRNAHHVNHSISSSAKHEYDNEERRGSTTSTRYLDRVQTNCPQDFSEEQESPMYYYPGYAFGQQLCTVPLVPFAPPTRVRVHSTHPWPIGTVQRKRRRRRKGYAEYAVIPPKKSTSECQASSLDGVHINNLSSKNTEDDEVVKETSLEYIPLKSDNTTSLENPASTVDISAVEKYLHLHAFTLCDQILSTAWLELRDKFSLNEKDRTDIHSSRTPLTEKELRDICQNILHCIIEEIVEQDFSNLQQIRESDMLHPNPNCRIDQEQLLNGEVRQYQDVKVLDLEEHSSCHESLEENIHRSNYQYFTEREINNEMKLLDEQNYCDLETINSVISKQNSRQVANGMSRSAGEDEGMLNSDITLPHKKLDSLQASPVTQQPRSETLRQACHTHLQYAELQAQKKAVESETDAAENVVCSTDLDYENDLMGSQVSHGFKTSTRNANDLINSHVETGENREIADTKESTSCLGTVSRDTEAYARLPHSVPPTFVSHLVSSDVLLRETELELSKLHQLTSNTALQPTQSIYKLAYDENFTDQSESEEPDEVSQAKQSIQKKSADSHTCSEECRPLQNDVMNSEILVHEADSASEAGSEDVELLPHRYQSESIQDCNKHIYVNNLSLAVEMLRTHENLPYDDEFKRIVDEDCNRASETANLSFYQVDLNNATGRLNPAFIEEVPTNQAVKNNCQRDSMPKLHSFRASHQNSTSSRNECRTSIADSGVQSGDSGDEMIEEAKEVQGTTSDIKQQQWQTDQTTNFRRFRQQTRQQFSMYTPRASILNPCLCCIVM